MIRRPGKNGPPDAGASVHRRSGRAGSCLFSHKAGKYDGPIWRETMAQRQQISGVVNKKLTISVSCLERKWLPAQIESSFVG
jgi:hypothetical protein